MPLTLTQNITKHMITVNEYSHIDQKELKQQIKAFKIRCGTTYEQLAKYCFVSESTFRNWMARKPIPRAKACLLLKLLNTGKDNEEQNQIQEKSAVSGSTISFSITPEKWERLKYASKPEGMDILTFIHSV